MMPSSICDNPCYDCAYKWTTHKCKNEDEKYKRIKERIARAEAEYGTEKFWIDIDFERDDEVAVRALKRVLEELQESGYTYSEPSYKQYIIQNALECGYHTGTLYIRKSMNKNIDENLK